MTVNTLKFGDLGLEAIKGAPRLQQLGVAVVRARELRPDELVNVHRWLLRGDAACLAKDWASSGVPSQVEPASVQVL